MFSSFILLFNFVLFDFCAFSDIYIYAEKQEEESFQELIEDRPESVSDVFSDLPELNYWADESLQSSQNLKLEGVDQRFLDLRYEGIRLRDPSHPTGVFDVGAFFGLSNKKIRLVNGQGLSLENSYQENPSFFSSLSSLGEASLGGEQSTCGETSCWVGQGRFQRRGGFSLSSSDKEKDYLDQSTFALSRLKEGERISQKDHLLLSLSYADLDGLSFNPSGAEVDSSYSKSSFFLIAKELEYNKKHSFKLSYLNINRKQANPVLSQTYRQKSDVIELQTKIFKNFIVNLYRESYGVYGGADHDEGFELGYQKVKGNFSFEIKAGASYLRKESFDFGASYKGLYLFYKRQPASLFQTFYNETFSPSLESLEPQSLTGIKYYKKLNSFLGVKASYYYGDEIVEFLNSGYSNLDKSHNAYVQVEAKYKGFGAYVQNQYSKIEGASVKESPRIPKWSLGLSYVYSFSRDFRFVTSGAWFSKRQAFDGSELNDFVRSEVSLAYKSFQIVAYNVLNQDNEIYKGLERRPLSFELNYKKVF